jgi:hypothetical protein
MSRLVTKLKLLVFKLSPHLALSLGLEFPLKSENRLFLENQIFDLLNTRFKQQSVRACCLFLGTDKRSWHYPKCLDAELLTLDIEPKKAIYGNRGHHTIGSAGELLQHYAPRSFDAIIANGLIGFGMNQPQDCEALLAGAHAVLKDSGLLVLGYNDGAEFVNFKVRDSKNYKLFEEFVPNHQTLNRCQYEFGDHTFVFLKPIY